MSQIGDFGSSYAGVVSKAYASNISRTTTSSSVLFTLPPFTTIIGISINGTPASNAGTSARISIGSSGGGGKDFVADYNVKSNNGQSLPSSAKLGNTNDPNPTIVTAIYAEDGSASNAGGPWTILFETI